MAKIGTLSLWNLRCLDEVVLVPGESFNIISGKNGEGKTTLLEGVHLVATGRLIRSSRESSAIQEGKDEARVCAELTESKTLLEMKLKRGTRRRALLNGMNLPRASDLLGRLPAVSFSARDLEIVRGDPASRRTFMDTEIAQISPAYLKSLTLYRRALDQRSALLRSAREHYVAAEQFEVWEQNLSDEGEVIRQARVDWLNSLIDEAQEAHAVLGSGEQLGLEYEVRSDPASMEAYASGRQQDIARGRTGVGPHRDDLKITVGGLEARQFGSQGQQRTAVIALKLSVLSAAQLAFGFAPVLLLDDVFSDLDTHRRSKLVEYAAQQGGQVFLTCTEPEQAGEELLNLAEVFRVESGRVESV